MARRILVVEDEESMCELLRLHLSSAGYAVEVAEDAIAADGDARARELGPSEYLRKPVRLEELLAAVSRHLPAKA